MKKYTPLLVQSVISVLVLFIGLLLYGQFVGPVSIGAEKDPNNKRTFTVEGEGKVEVTPDKFYTDFSINERGTTQENAKNKANEKQEKALAELKKLGFADKDLKTQNFNINPEYDYGIVAPDREPRLVGYTAYVTTQVTADTSEKVEQAIDVLTPIGINVSGVQSTIGDVEAYKDKARELAIAHAKRKAESTAKSAEFELGKLKSISEANEYGGFPDPMPLMREGRGEAADLKAMPATEINPGTNEVTVRVSVTYFIED